MDGKLPPRASKTDFSDPFNAGQMVGMLVMLTFVETNKGIPIPVLEKLKMVTATNLEAYFDKPVEDIFLMVDRLVDKIEEL